jgi:hypothetical protein
VEQAPIFIAAAGALRPLGRTKHRQNTGIDGMAPINYNLNILDSSMIFYEANQ